ncbi:MAG: PqqD family protein [Oscillospiraceae bacterium]|nr:PqqD family protein [Oscillospiraceae bacterium]
MKRSADFLLREVAGTQVLVPLGAAAVSFSGMVTLNGTGAFIWELLEQPQTMQTLTEALMDRYAVDQETAQNDVEGFVNKLIPIGAILEN